MALKCPAVRVLCPACRRPNVLSELQYKELMRALQVQLSCCHCRVKFRYSPLEGASIAKQDTEPQFTNGTKEASNPAEKESPKESNPFDFVTEDHSHPLQPLSQPSVMLGNSFPQLDVLPPTPTPTPPTDTSSRHAIHSAFLKSVAETSRFQPHGFRAYLIPVLIGLLVIVNLGLGIYLIRTTSNKDSDPSEQPPANTGTP